MQVMSSVPRNMGAQNRNENNDSLFLTKFFRSDLGFRIIAEQVSHHPPVSAFHADNPDFRFHGAIHPKLKFWGKSVEAIPKGTVCLALLKLVWKIFENLSLLWLKGEGCIVITLACSYPILSKHFFLATNPSSSILDRPLLVYPKLFKPHLQQFIPNYSMTLETQS